MIAETALARPSRLAVILSLIILIAYFGFVLLASLRQGLMGTVLFSGLSVGILLAASVLILCMVLSIVFVAVSSRIRIGA